jgi:hypothetical protein
LIFPSREGKICIAFIKKMILVRMMRLARNVIMTTYLEVMSAKRRNPKKDPTARRRRGGGGVPALRQARFRLDDVVRLLMNAPAEVLPLMALPAVWLWNAAEDRQAAAHCVDCCVTLQYALAEYGIASSIQAVGVGIATPGTEPQMYGGGDGLRPHYNEDGTFNGHTLLVIPAAGRLLDPTIQQFPEIPRTARGGLPIMGRLPVPGGLGTKPISVDRTDHFVVYFPLSASYRDAWQSPVVAQRADEYREAGANLADNVFDVMRGEGFRDRTARSPYPRLQALLAALDGMTSVADSRGYRFADPATGRELRLADIP